MATVLVTSRVVGVTVPEARAQLQAARLEIVENPYLHRGTPLNEDEFASLLKGVDGVIVGDDDVTARVIEKADRLKIISKNGVGLNRIDVAAATARNIVVTNTPGTNNDAVADLTFGLMLAAARRIPQSHADLRGGQWDRRVGVEVWRKTMGIVGVGNVGKAVAKRARGFAMRILGYDVVRDPQFAREVGMTYVDLGEVFRAADFVTIHLPLNEQTRGLVSRRYLSMMKPTAYILNLARGGVIKNDDLREALGAKELAGAAIDVFDEEPPFHDPLLKCDDVIATPHIGAYTRESLNAMAALAVRNLIEVLEGRPCAHVVNPEALLGKR